MAKDDSDLAIDIGVSMQKLNRQLAKVEADFVKAAKKQEASFKKTNERIAKDFDRLQQQANASLSKIRAPTGLSSLGGLGAGLAGALSARELVRMTSTWTDLSGRVGLAVGQMDQAPEVMKRISEMARRTYSSLELTAESYLANATTLRELGLSTSESLDFTEALNNALVVSGAKAQTAASVQDALSKAMALGALKGDQLNTVIASGGRVAELLAEELGVGVNQLRKIGTEGGITGAVIDKALRGNLEKLRTEADSMSATISDAFQLLQNAVLEYVGTTDKGLDASERLAAALIFVADNIDLVVAAGGVLAGRVLGPAMLALLTRTSAAFVATAAALRTTAATAGAAAAAMTGLKAAMSFLGGPIGLVLAGLTALPLVTTSAAERTAELRRVGEGAATALNAFAEASEKAKAEQSGLAGEVSRTTANLLMQSRAALQVSLKELRKQAGAQDGRLTGSSNWIFAGEIDGAVRVLEPAARAGAEFNSHLSDIRTGLQGIGSRKTDVAALVARMDQLAGVGDEVSGILAEVDARLKEGDSRALEEAKVELIRLAEAAGAFEAELAAVKKAKTAEEQRAAFDLLRKSMGEASQAGQVLRDTLMSSLRENLSDWANTEILISAVEEALKGNLQAAQAILANGNPFAKVEAGASSATTAVNALKEAMDALPKEIQTRVSGLENASEGLTASASLLRQFEGFSATPYWDVNAYRAGFGSDEITLADGSVHQITAGMRVSVEDANRDLLRRIGNFQDGIRRDIGAETFESFNPAQQAALTSVAYNYGSLPDRIVAAIRSGNNDSIVTAIASLQEHNGGVNRDRRLAEASIFANGVGVESAAQRQESDAAKAKAEAEREAKDAITERTKAEKEAKEARADLVKQATQQVNDAAFEVELIGKTASEQARLRAIYLLTNDAKARGIDLNERLAGSEKTYGDIIAEQAAKVGEYVAQQDRRTKAVENAAEREQFLVGVQDTLKDGLLDAIVAGNSFADVLGNVAKMLAKAALEAALFGSGPFSGGGSGLLGGLFGSIFGGGDKLVGALRGAGAPAVLPGRANGGPVTAGQMYMTGERGPEPFVPAVNGRILSVPQAQAALRGGQGGGSATFAPQIHIAGDASEKTVALIKAALAQEGAKFPSRWRAAQKEFSQRT
ncbi:tape measure protein [Paracoccus aminophilus]|uniref:Lysozyme n=1 Tax=Paracoccus aminophilus JCM 7686 TaxID=1367847 RepID=S5XT66_PARAH|nr:tape measure protein [Paracoccus aminophilus]AGT08352.1 phage-related minor tail protein [Paracoccus aminophilus JCM 7686]